MAIKSISELREVSNCRELSPKKESMEKILHFNGLK